MKFYKLFAVLVLFGAIVAAAVIWAQDAHATPTDNLYLRDLDSAGVTYPDDQYAIDAGHEICRVLPHWSVPDLAADIDKKSGLDATRSQDLVDAAITYYCPKFKTAGILQPHKV